MKPHQLKALHVSIAAMLAAVKGTDKALNADYKAVAATVKSLPLNDADAMKAFRADLFETFGEDRKDAAQIRWNIINNARKVAHGGTKDGKTVKGKGHGVMLEVLASVASVRDLKSKMAEAVPAALKGESGGKREKSGRKAEKGKGNVIALPRVATKEQAFAAARKVLEFCLTHFVKPSEAETTTKVQECIKALS